MAVEGSGTRCGRETLAFASRAPCPVLCPWEALGRAGAAREGWASSGAPCEPVRGSQSARPRVVPGSAGLSLGPQQLRVPLAPRGLPRAPGALGPAGAHPACRRALL